MTFAMRFAAIGMVALAVMGVVAIALTQTWQPLIWVIGFLLLAVVIEALLREERTINFVGSTRRTLLLNAAGVAIIVAMAVGSSLAFDVFAP